MKKLLVLGLVALLTFGCAPQPTQSVVLTPVLSFNNSGKSLRIVGSPPLEVLMPAISEFNKKSGSNVQLVTKPTIEISNILKEGAKDIDAVAPSTEQWISMAGANLLVPQTDVFFKSPIVVAVRKSKAEELKLVNRNDVTVREFHGHVAQKRLTFAMPQPSLSGVGSTAHIAFIDALKGRSGVQTKSDLQNQDLRKALQELYQGVERSSADSKTLVDQVRANPDQFQAFINYEAFVLQINEQLVKDQKEPYVLVYLIDGMASAEFPLGLVERGDEAKRQLMQEFKTYLRTEEVQKQIHEKGWRTGLYGLVLEDKPPVIFNSLWGVQKNPVGSLQYPNVEVLKEAIFLYQTLFRRGSLRIYVADHSGSMNDSHTDQASGKTVKRIDALRSSFASLVNPDLAAQYNLLPTDNDVTIVVPFCQGIPRNQWRVENFTVVGRDKNQINTLLGRVNSLTLCGGTDLFDGLDEAVRVLVARGIGDLSPSIILLTDGERTGGLDEGSFIRNYKSANFKIRVPIYAILFGNARSSDVANAIKESGGAWWDARTTDLPTITRRVAAQN